MFRSAFAAAVAVTVVGVSQACAADLAVKGPAPRHVVMNWNGFYIGGHLGYGQGRTSITDPATPGASLNTTVKGFLGGGQLGYNAQIGSWVLGVEADFSGADIDGTTTFVEPGTGDVSTSRPQIRWTSLATARVGYVFDRTLWYAKGGVAFAGFRYNMADLTNGTTGSTNINRTGWTVGGGLEYALTPNWSIRGEYDYLSFGNRNFSMRDSTGVVGTLGLRQHLHQVKFGVNYRFGG